jgi:VIT1/CCC1 family predicted Fe2+/Mn2+ transporter
LFRNSSTGTRGAGQPQSRDADPRDADSRMEALHIGATAATSGNLSDEDRSYLANLVASRTGIAPEEAQKRVDAFIQHVKDVAARAKAAADDARKTAATAALYTALSLLIGAFIASVAAAIGGRLRDEHL